ncbi:MAG: amidohydrolase [Alphaproteobacteria bacterium]|nr:amidohydrolase [Alphaproteobacteria bacterium]
MFNGHRVIDVHGHISSPPAVRAFAFNLGAFNSPEDKLTLTDEQVRPAMERHLRLLDERDVDVQLLSARPVAMMHWERPRLTDAWTRVTNDLIAQQCRLAGGRFAGVAQLPQNARRDTSNCIEELERCVCDLGFVAATVNPDPGADRGTPGMDDPYWFPLYKRASELEATLIVHPSVTHDPRLDSVPHSYQFNNLVEEALATLLLETSDVFTRFPKLRIVVCHCGGALRRMVSLGDPIDAIAQGRGEDNRIRSSDEFGGGQVGMPVEMKTHVRPDLSNNLFFDTCAYDPHFLAAALHQRGTARMVFGTEAPGSGSAYINPQTGRPADDVLAILRGFDFLTEGDIIDLVNLVPRKVFPLLAKLPLML